jgi:hypothetical protein
VEEEQLPPRGSLRGSSASSSQTEQPTITTTKTYSTKASELDLGQLLNDPAQYPGFRFNLETQLTCAEVDPDMAELFVQDMNSLPKEQLVDAVLPSEMKQLDRRLFKSIIKLIKGREHDEHLKDVQAQTKMGCGRHAVRVLDEAFEFEAVQVAVNAAAGVVNAEVKDVGQLGRYVTHFRLHVQELQNTGHALPGLFVLEMVRKATVDLKDQRVQAIIANFEAQPKQEQTAKILLDALFQFYITWRTRQSAKQQLTSVIKGAAAKRTKQQGLAFTNDRSGGGATGLTDPQGNPLCNYCGKGNHRWKDCRKRVTDEKNGVSTPMHVPKAKAKAKVKGRATAARTDRQPAFDPCPICKKTNHPPEKCYFKKKGEIVDGEPVLTGGSSASAALSSEAEIGALLTKVLSSKLKEKV